MVSEGSNTMDVGRDVLAQTKPKTRLDAGTWGTIGVASVIALRMQWLVAIDLLLQLKGILDSDLTLVQYRLPMVVIVFNNGGVYGGDRRIPKEINGPHKDDPAPTSFVSKTGYHTLIEVFGGKRLSYWHT
ncbi:2-hydroxyacyl-CoA lyase-like [Arachis ipaensis]|uniref:Thiamine pyrophosphate enzyme TPP-binding domain-containing protein n=1 Tax=Arachis hypogaea TaxID=3818 RepID=A0A444XCA7_ARAHY|nr:2-hydroxyacyl-CoA lyase-like [Arachis ipaensis]RYQ87345.1 hypothetical protein Ahy_B09g094852 [Arachis hypogaea]